MLLNEIQEHFRDLMLDHPDAVYALGDEFSAVFEEKQIPLPDRLKVYRNNIVGSLTDVVVAGFPVMEVLVGKEFMEGMARSFVLKQPPEQGCLNQYGAGFDDFVRDFAPAQSLPYLSDVARMELAMNKAYYAKDQAAVTAEDFGQILPDHLAETEIEIGANVHCLSFDYPVSRIREYCLNEEAQKEALDLDGGGEKLMIHRPALEVFITALADDEYEMIRNLREHNLGDAVELTMVQYPEFDFQAFLQKHLDLKTFTDLK